MSNEPPMPVDSIPEAGYAFPRRPGVITGLGTTSIVIASLAILMAPMGILWAVIIYGANNAAATVVNTAIRAQGDLLTAAKAQVAMSDAEADIAIRVLETIQGLSQDQRSQLRAMLRDSGKEIFPSASTEPAVFNSVSNSGVLKDADGANAGTYFVLSEGKLEIYGDRCVYSIAGKEPLIVQAGVDRGSAQLSATTLRPGQVVALIERANRVSNRPLSPSQVEQLRGELSKPDQSLVTPHPSRTRIANELLSAHVDTDGNALVLFTGGQVQLPASGPVAATLYGTPRTAPAVRAMGASGTIYLSLALLLATFIAIYLLVAGILTLRGSRLGGRLHYIYCGLMVLCAAMLGIGLWMFIIDLTMTSIAGTTPAGSTGAAVAAIIVGFLVLLHPAMVLILLQTSGAREFY